MQKKVFFILISTLFALFGGVSLYAQSCSTPFSGTTFQPKTGITSENYNIDQIRLEDPSSEVLTTGMTFKNSNTLDRGEYTISNNTIKIATKTAGQYGIISYALSNLMTTAGQNQYRVEITVKTYPNPGCSPTMESHRGVNYKFSVGNYNTYYEVKNTTHTFGHTFTAPAGGKISISLASDYSNDCYITEITSVKVIGCSPQKIVSENGDRVCAGSENQLIAKGLTATSYTWQQSEDAGATWTTIPQTTKVITVLPTTETLYRVTADGTMLPAITVRPIVCCAVAGGRAIIAAERFTFSGTNLGARTQKTPTMISGNATTDYIYKSSGNIDEGQYAIVKSSKIDGSTYWQDRGLTGNSTSLSIAEGTDKGTSDGFLLVNADVPPAVFYEQTFTDLCPNTIYDFSAFVANVTKESGQVRAPVNVGFKVFGCNGTNCTEDLLRVESGDLPPSTNWVEKGGSFNSKGFTSVKVQLFNNLDSSPYVDKDGKVIGNDIAIDDITFSTCSPEIQVFSNAEYTEKDQTFSTENTERVYVWAPYELTEFFSNPWYVIQESPDGTSNWTNIYSGTNDYVDVNITLAKYLDKKHYYRAFVAADQATAEARAANPTVIQTGCGQISAISDQLWLTMEKPCTPTDAPIVTNYDECPLTGTGTLADLVTSDKTNLRWYAQATGGTALTTTTFDWTTVGTRTFYVSNQLADQGTTTYCESTRTPVTINIKPGVTFTVDKSDINVCTNSTNAERTFTISNKLPTSATITWKAMSDLSVLGTGNTYTVPATVGQGELLVEGTDPTGCDFSEPVRYEVKALPDFTLTAPTMVCVSAPSATLTANITTDENGNTYTWYKGTNQLATGTLVAETSITHTDPTVGTTQGDVTYRLVIDNGICQTEKTATIAVKPDVTFTVDKSDINVCTNSTNAERTFTISNKLPTSATITWKAMSDLSVLETGNTYTVPATVGQGELLVEGTDPSACLATDAVTYELLNTPDFTLSAPTMVCVSNPVAEIKAQVSAGSGSYQWFKNGVEVANGTMTLGQTEITYNDPAVASAEGSVTYRLKLDNGICFTEKTVSVSVGDRIDIPITASAPAQNNTICLGATIDLTAGYTLNAGESLTWTVGGVVVPETGTVLASQQPTANTTYLVNLVGGTCEGDGSITINVDTPPAPAITVDKDVICEGTQINITDSDPNTATSYVWMQEISPYAYQEISQQTAKDISGFTPTETANYKKISYNGMCSVESNEVTVTVYPAIVFNIEPIDRTICEGEDVTITMSGYPTGSTTEWFDKATTSLISSDPSTVVTPLQTTVYTARVTNICTAEKDLTISVLPPMNPQISQPTAICLGDSTILTVSGNGIVSYSWVPSGSLDSPSAATTIARPKTNTQYIVTVGNGVCDVTATTEVTVNALPLFDTIEEQNTENCTTRSVTVTAKEGTPPYQFSEDGDNFTTQNVFTGMTSGWNTLFVTDVYTCKGDTSFYLEPYPIIPDRFVTPNNDNTNELWTVENLNCYSAYIVEIFDRFGKRLYEWRKGSYSKSANPEDFPGWDGMYNGHQLPSTDYWYLITVEEIRKQYNGNFILKR